MAIQLAMVSLRRRINQSKRGPISPQDSLWKGRRHWLLACRIGAGRQETFQAIMMVVRDGSKKVKRGLIQHSPWHGYETYLSSQTLSRQPQRLRDHTIGRVRCRCRKTPEFFSAHGELAARLNQVVWEQSNLALRTIEAGSTS